MDTPYNHPKYKKVISSLKKQLQIVDFGMFIKSISSGATPLLAKKEQYADSGIKFLRIQNITPIGFDLSDVKYITENVNNSLLKRSQLSENDLLMTITGRIGTCAVVDSTCLPANINQHIVRIRLKDDVNPYFIVAYLNSSIGLLLSNRAVTGTTRTALDYESIKKIPVPKLSMDNQLLLYSINKDAIYNYLNRQKQIKKLLDDFEQKIVNSFNLTTKIQPHLCFAISRAFLDGVIDVKRYVSKEKNIGNLIVSNVCYIIDKKINVSQFDKQVIDWIRIDDLPNQPLDIDNIRTQPACELNGTFFEVHEGDILVARLGPTILNQKIIMVRSLKRTTIASSEFLVLRCKDGYIPETVMAVLKTNYYRNLMYSHSRGSTPSRYRLNKEDMLKLPFPDIRAQQTQLAKESDELRIRIKILRMQAEQEWQAAKEQFEKELLGEQYYE